MTITRKPRRPGEGAGGAGAPRVDVDAIINRGGTVASETEGQARSKPSRKTLLLSLYPETLERIGRAVAARPVRITRQLWIEEAIQEKLAREPN